MTHHWILRSRLSSIVLAVVVVFGGLPSVALADTEPNDTRAGAEPLAVGVTAAGTLTPGDEDWYRIAAQRGQALEVTATRPAGTLDGYVVSLVNAGGGTLASVTVSPTDTRTIGVTVTVTGTYYVRVTGDAGGYEVTVTTPATDSFEPNERRADAVPYTLGAVQGGTLTAGDRDWFRFEATRGQALVVTAARPAAATDSYSLRVVGPTESANLRVSPGDVRIYGDTVETTGTYYVEVVGDAGSYEFSATLETTEPTEPNDRRDEATGYVPGTPQNGTLTLGDEDWFSFTAERGQSIEVTASRPASATDGYALAVFDPTGSTVAGRQVLPGRTETTGVVVETAGTHYVEVDGDAGRYEFVVSVETTDPFEPNQRRADATPYTVGTTQTGRLTLGDEDWFSFTAERGQSVEVTASRPASAVDAYRVSLWADAPGVLARGSLIPGNTRTIGDTIETSGTYYVRVDGNSGSYEFTVTATRTDGFEPNEGRTDAVPLVATRFVPIAGSFRAGDEDWFAVPVTAGQSLAVTASLSANGSGGSVRLHDPDGDVIESAFILPNGTGTVRTVVATAGTHYLSLAGNAAGYTVDARVDGQARGLPNDRFEPNENRLIATAIGPGTYDDLAIPTGDRDYFKIDVAAGERLDADIRTDPTLVFRLGLLDAAGHFVTESSTGGGEESVSVLAPADGPYYLVVHTLSEGGEYELSVSVTGPIDVAVGPGDVVVPPGETLTVDIVVDGAREAVESFDLTVETSNATALTLTGATAAHGTANVTLSPDGSSVRVVVVDAAAASGDPLVVARVTVRATAEGAATLSVTDSPSVRTALGHEFPVATLRATSVTIADDPLAGLFARGIPGGSSGRPPTDTDGDGRFDDMDGNGRFDFVDVIEFVFAIQTGDFTGLSQQELDSLNHEDGDDVINFVDVIDLVFQLQS